jgi:hypothetical protein
LINASVSTEHFIIFKQENEKKNLIYIYLLQVLREREKKIDNIFPFSQAFLFLLNSQFKHKKRL